MPLYFSVVPTLISIGSAFAWPIVASQCGHLPEWIMGKPRNESLVLLVSYYRFRTDAG